MPQERLTIAYPGIGYGRPGFAQALESWAERINPEMEVNKVDVLQLPNINWWRKFVLRCGYRALSQLPPSLYNFARRTVDESGDFQLLTDPEKSRSSFPKESIIVSVSPLSSAILSGLGINHSAVVGDNHLSHGYLTPCVEKLYLPWQDVQNCQALQGKNIETVEIGGTPQHPNLATVDWQEKRQRLTLDGNPTIGLFTHGAGELSTVLSLIGLRRGLLEKRLHAAFFVGHHRHMSVLLKGLAQCLQIPLDNPNQMHPGSISVWEGNNVQEALDQRNELLPQLDLAVLATANENTCTGPLLIGGIRNLNEAGNRQISTEKGWAVNRRSPVFKLWLQIEALLKTDQEGSTPAQRMLDIAQVHLDFQAGGNLIRNL